MKGMKNMKVWCSSPRDTVPAVSRMCWALCAARLAAGTMIKAGRCVPSTTLHVLHGWIIRIRTADLVTN